MDTCKQIKLFLAHVDVANRHNGSNKRPKDKKGKGAAARARAVVKVCPFNTSNLPQQLQQPPSASPTASSASLPRQQCTLPPAGQRTSKDKGGKGKGQ